jgi:hypothetical protein
LHYYRRVRVGGRGLQLRGLFTPELSAHTSNYRELLTVYAGLRRSRELHSGGEHLNVVAYTDNSVSAACVNSGTSKSAELLPLVKEMGLYMVCT